MNKEGFSLPRPRGFTLLEMLVAMAILALLVVVLLGIVDGATKLWRTSENRIDSFREARAALNVIHSELKGLFVTTNTAYFRQQAATNGSEIFFVTALPVTAQNSDSRSTLCTVGYYLAYERPTLNAEQPTLNLYRFFRDSNATFARISNAPTTPDLFSGVNPAPGGARDDIVARNIVQFAVKSYTIGTNGLPTDFVQSPTTPFPDLIQLEIAAVNADAAKRLGNRSDWNASNPAIADQVRQFITRIDLREISDN